IMSLTDLLNRAGRRPEAEALIQRSLAVTTELGGQDATSVESRRALAVCWHNLGVQLQKIGRVREARDAYERLHALRQRLADESPSNAGAQWDAPASLLLLAIAQGQAGELPEAERTFQQHDEVVRKLLDRAPGHPPYRHALAKSLRNRAFMLGSIMNRPEE